MCTCRCKRNKRRGCNSLRSLRLSWRLVIGSRTPLQHTATHCNTLQRTAMHCNTLQHTATHGNTREHTATHGITRHHTATHGNAQHHNAHATGPACVYFVKFPSLRVAPQTFNNGLLMCVCVLRVWACVCGCARTSGCRVESGRPHNTLCLTHHWVMSHISTSHISHIVGGGAEKGRRST